MVRATALITLGEGDVRWTNPKLLHSTRRCQRAEEQRAGEKKETKQETEKEYKRVRQLVSQQRNSQKQHWCSSSSLYKSH